MNDLVSVIIPVYNRQDVVEACVRSVLCQSYQNIEIILIDDGSADRSVEICRHLEGEDSRVTLLTIDHAGVSAARNRGIDLAKGQFLFFIDSDDVIHPGLLEALLTGLNNSDASIAGTGIIPVSSKNWGQVKDCIANDPGPGVTSYHSHKESMDAIFRTTTPINLIGGVMMRRELVGDTRFREDLFIGEDFYFVYENLNKGASTIFLKQSWYYARSHANNSSWNYSFDGFWTRFYRRKLVWENEEAMGRTENARIQKRDGFGCYLRCYPYNATNSEDNKRMREVLRSYKDILFSAFDIKGKCCFFLSVYMPDAYLFLRRAYKKMKKLLRK